MAKIKNIFIPIIFFSLTFIFFYNLQFTTTNIPGYDGYYHIKIAEILKNEGFIKKFPWLQMTDLKDHFVDQHFLYHILLIPFTYFGLIEGAKLSAVFFASAMVLTFYLFLKGTGIRFPFIWSLGLLSSSYPFLFRMCLPKAPAIALIFLFAGLYTIFKKKYFMLALVSFCFVWLYVGFTIIILFSFLAFLGIFLVKRDFAIKIILFPLIGSAAGLIINPYFPYNLKFIFIQTTKAGISRVVRGGGEWQSYDPFLLLKGTFFLFLILIISFIVFKKSKNKISYETVTLILISISLLLMTLKSKRFVEFFIPFTLLTSSFLVKDAKERLFSSGYKPGIYTKFLAYFLLIFILAGFGKYQFNMTQKDLISDQRPVDRYKGAAIWLENFTPASTVYTTDWDDFPELFFYNSKNRYLIGLDPAFFYLYDKRLYRKWDLINSGQFDKNLYDALAKDFKTPYVFTDSSHKEFIRAADKSPYLRLEYADPYSRIYALIRGKES